MLIIRIAGYFPFTMNRDICNSSCNISRLIWSDQFKAFFLFSFPVIFLCNNQSLYLINQSPFIHIPAIKNYYISNLPPLLIHFQSTRKQYPSYYQHCCYRLSISITHPFHFSQSNQQLYFSSENEWWQEFRRRWQESLKRWQENRNYQMTRISSIWIKRDRSMSCCWNWLVVRVHKWWEIKSFLKIDEK